MDEIGRELHDVLPARARGLESNLDVAKYLGGLICEVALACKLAARIRAEHAGDKEIFRRLDPRHMRILAERHTQFGDVIGLDLGTHCSVPLPFSHTGQY